MKCKLFTIYDSKAEFHHVPFAKPATGMALREFADMASNQDHPIGQHPEDYTLFEIGTFDDEHAEISLYEAKRPLGNGAEYNNRETRDELKNVREAINR